MRTNGDQSTINHRFTVPEAAQLLGISPEAVRARIHRGTLRKEKGADGTVYVRLDYDQSPPNGNGADDQTPDQTPMVEVLREQVAYLKEQLDREREARTEERRRQDTIIAQLTQANASLSARIPALEAVQGPVTERQASDAPQETPHGPQETAGDDAFGTGHRDDPAPEKGTSSGGFWRRLFGG